MHFFPFILLFITIIVAIFLTSTSLASINDWSSVPEKQASTPVIPKKIWTFWNTESVPYFVSKCIENMQRMNPTYNVTLVSEATVKEFISTPLPTNFDVLMPAYKADWVRVALLVEHGGIWLDSSTVLMQPLDFIDDLQKGAEGVAFYMQGYNIHYPKFPVVENWFFASVAGSDFMKKLLAESTFVYESFPDPDDSGYLDYLDAKLGSEMRKSIEQNLGVFKNYLKQHVAMQYVMQVVGANPFATYSATSLPHGPLVLQDRCGWNDDCTIDLLWKERDPNVIYPAIVKLVGSQRKKVDGRLNSGAFPHPESVFGTILKMKSAETNDESTLESSNDSKTTMQLHLKTKSL